MNRKLYAPAAAGLILLGACMGPDDPNRRAKTGAAIGAVAGAILGHQMDGDSGRFVGAALGALAGGVVGNYMDEQQQAFEQELKQEQEQHQLEIERLKDDTLKLTVDSEVSFDFARAEVKPAFYGSLDKLAAVIVKYDRTVVHVVGHTDSVGSDEYNYRLSQERAQSVVDYLVQRGVPASRLRAEGRGEREPRASNDSEAGRQLNRRVEIFVKPVIEGRESEAYDSPRYL